ncbi:hypothetical protein [Kiloniella sp. b19]|uniref:hypothetical protein n=1 Tax=Kiloniella sp. GXU_MW_B19 TaxID=3141326 RepID=UPI0031D1EB29
MTRSANQTDTRKQGQKMDYFSRHWRGEFGVRRSVLVNFLLANVLFVLALFLVLRLVGFENLTNPAVLMKFAEFLAFNLGGGDLTIEVCSVLMALVALNVWSMVGLWRKAARCKAENGIDSALYQLAFLAQGLAVAVFAFAALITALAAFFLYIKLRLFILYLLVIWQL